MSEEKPSKPEKKSSSGIKAARLVFTLLLIAAAAVSVKYFFFQTPQDTATVTTRTVAVQKGTLTVTGTASGTTAKGALSQTVSWSAGSTQLIVEKVFKKSGETAAQGEVLLKLTDDSVTAVRKQLESDMQAATTALTQAEMNRQHALVQAKADLEASLAAKSAAKAVYNETIQSLNDALTTAKDALSDAKTIISTYPSQIAALKKSITATETTLANAQAAVTSAQAGMAIADGIYQSAKRKADQTGEAVARSKYMLEWAEKYALDNSIDVTDPAADPSFIVFADFLNDLRADLSEKELLDAEAVLALNAAKAPYDQAKTTQSAAQSAASAAQQSLQSLNSDLNMKEKSLDQTKANLANLELRSVQAISDQKSKSVAASETYQSSLLTGDNAQNTYDVAILKADKVLSDAKEKLDASKISLDQFMKNIGDGNIKAAYAGSLTSIGYEAGATITSTTAVATYSNASVMTVTATVDQADIADLSVGDTVNVAFSSGVARTYQGKIATISLTAASTSVSAVKYTVTLTVEGNVTNMTSGQTVTVSFVKDALENALYVDAGAIVSHSGGTFVDKQENGQTRLTPVTTGKSNGQFITVLSGLAEGDVCVITQTAQKS